MTVAIHHSTPVIIDVDMTVVGRVLERSRAALSADDHACLQGLVHTLRRALEARARARHHHRSAPSTIRTPGQ
jgi:hypothetical protein